MYQIEHRNLHHTLVEIGCAIFDDLDGHDLLGLEILAFDDLAKGALTQHIEDEIAISTQIVYMSQMAYHVKI
jgi:hypothetical protein